MVGRSTEADITISAKSVSSRHARITFDGDRFAVEDLNSTNGTFLNGNAITRAIVKEGDLLQFANSFYRVGREQGTDCSQTLTEGIVPWAQTLLLFDQLINQRSVIPFYQPIVLFSDRLQVSAFEILARSNLEYLNNPATMFGAAERMGEQATLSEIMRDIGVRVACENGIGDTELFLNTHPCEIINDRFVNSLQNLRDSFPSANIAIEIHEAAITAPKSIIALREVLSELHMRLSYDDFGAGQGRLLELAEAPPDVLKFDMQLIRDINSASATRQELLATLVQLAKDLNSTPLAEGVETEAEHETCRQIGFVLGQGYLYGRPSPDCLVRHQVESI